MTKKEDKIADPANSYKRPHEVDNDKELSLREKITTLENWRDDIKLRQIAEAENMPSPVDQRTYIGEVETLLQKLKQRL